MYSSLVVIIALLITTSPVVSADNQFVVRERQLLPIIKELFIDGKQLVILPNVNFTMTATLAWPSSALLPPNATLRYSVVSSQSDSTLLASGVAPVYNPEDDTLVDILSIKGLRLTSTGTHTLTLSLSHVHATASNSAAVAKASVDGFVVIGGLTVLPPIFAIVLAFATGDAVPSLFVGVWVAAFLVAQYNPASSLLRTLDFYITNAFATDYRVQIVLFCWFMSAMVCMLFKAGGGTLTVYSTQGR